MFQHVWAHSVRDVEYVVRWRTPLLKNPPIGAIPSVAEDGQTTEEDQSESSYRRWKGDLARCSWARWLTRSQHLVAPRNPKWIRQGPVLSGHCPYTFLTTELLKVGWTISRLGWATKIHKVGSCWTGSYRGSVFGTVLYPFCGRQFPELLKGKFESKKYDWKKNGSSILNVYFEQGKQENSSIIYIYSYIYIYIYMYTVCTLPSINLT